MSVRSEPRFKRSVYWRLSRNRPLVLLWSGEAISIFGDAFFNLAILWVVYTQSGSAFQTALVGVVWHLSDILFGPFAGILADRRDRKRIMVLTNLAAAGVVGLAALVVAGGYLSSVIALAAVFVLNTLTTFLKPARASVMPELVGRDLLATASGLFSTIKNVATFLGNALAGLVIVWVGATWALVIDAASFVVVAVCIALARLPERTVEPSSATERPSLLRGLVSQIADGWRVIQDRPIMRAMVWIGVLINAAAFLGPLYPALVDQRLHLGAAAYGAIEAAAVVGGVGGGLSAGPFERRLGAGRVMVLGWAMAGLCTVGIAASTSLPLTAMLEAGLVFGLTAGAVSMGAVTLTVVPEDYRGRVFGIMGSLSVLAIPVSTLVGGVLADLVGVVPLFAAGGVYVLAIAAFSWANPAVRLARV